MKNLCFFDGNPITLNFFYFFEDKMLNFERLSVINTLIVNLSKWHQKKALQLQLLFWQ